MTDRYLLWFYKVKCTATDPSIGQIANGKRRIDRLHSSSDLQRPTRPSSSGQSMQQQQLDLKSTLITCDTHSSLILLLLLLLSSVSS